MVLLAGAVTALLNPGNFGTIDTEVRLRVARWIRLGEPLNAGEFGVPGRNGMLQPHFGIGQSLVLLPLDALADCTLTPVLRRAGLNVDKQRQGAEVLTAFLMQWVLASSALILAYLLLRLFEFGSLASAAGAISLLFGTTCLAYVQCAQENLLLLVLALGSLCGIRQWLRDGRLVWCAVAGAALGFALLTRLTAVLQLPVFAAMALCWHGNWRRFLAGFLPPVLVAVLLERFYQWYRFGNLLGSYVETGPPGSPPSYPFNAPFWRGFLGTLFSPDKSIFLFDPLLLLLIGLAVWRWRRLGRDLRIALLGLGALLRAPYRLPREVHCLRRRRHLGPSLRRTAGRTSVPLRRASINDLWRKYVAAVSRGGMVFSGGFSAASDGIHHDGSERRGDAAEHRL